MSATRLHFAGPPDPSDAPLPKPHVQLRAPPGDASQAVAAAVWASTSPQPALATPPPRATASPSPLLLAGSLALPLPPPAFASSPVHEGHEVEHDKSQPLWLPARRGATAFVTHVTTPSKGRNTADTTVLTPSSMAKLHDGLPDDATSNPPSVWHQAAAELYGGGAYTMPKRSRRGSVCTQLSPASSVSMMSPPLLSPRVRGRTVSTETVDFDYRDTGDACPMSPALLSPTPHGGSADQRTGHMATVKEEPDGSGTTIGTTSSPVPTASPLVPQPVVSWSAVVRTPAGPAVELEAPTHSGAGAGAGAGAGRDGLRGGPKPARGDAPHELPPVTPAAGTTDAGLATKSPATKPRSKTKAASKSKPKSKRAATVAAAQSAAAPKPLSATPPTPCRTKEKGSGRAGKVNKYHALRKTELCMFFMESTCPRSREECAFAHGEADLHVLSAEERTRLGLAAAPKSYRTAVCHRWEQGSCSYGNRCRFLHNHVPVGDDVAVADAPKPPAVTAAQEGSPTLAGGKANDVEPAVEATDVVAPTAAAPMGQAPVMDDDFSPNGLVLMAFDPAASSWDQLCHNLQCTWSLGNARDAMADAEPVEPLPMQLADVLVAVSEPEPEPASVWAYTHPALGSAARRDEQHDASATATPPGSGALLRRRSRLPVFRRLAADDDSDSDGSRVGGGEDTPMVAPYTGIDWAVVDRVLPLARPHGHVGMMAGMDPILAQCATLVTPV